MKTWVLDNEKAQMEAVAYIRSLDIHKFSPGEARVELHIPKPQPEYYSDETNNLGEHHSGHE